MPGLCLNTGFCRVRMCSLANNEGSHDCFIMIMLFHASVSVKTQGSCVRLTERLAKPRAREDQQNCVRGGQLKQHMSSLKLPVQGSKKKIFVYGPVAFRMFWFRAVLFFLSSGQSFLFRQIIVGFCPSAFPFSEPSGLHLRVSGSLYLH